MDLYKSGNIPPPALMPVIATLCYVLKGGKILLIKKKKGLGAGKWNGPGGRVEDRERIADAAMRETKEEVGLLPVNLVHAGINEFYENGKLEWVVHIFVADKFSGEEKESDEASPHWFRLDSIPYDNMWPDDKLWMPLML